ncbi:hypothetical protein BBJ28_00010349 [Nothophytophthora sp. Chile5]|nr:hypothetical protein BBJ28_00010349 [Nothophytophthora sp. Chile5]
MRDKALKSAREEQQELEALHRLDEECVHQQRAVLLPFPTTQGNYLKAFDCMERALVLRRHFFGLESDEVVQACRALAEMCNLLAMSFLQQDNYAVTIDLLKKAEVLTQRHHPAERATTLNNLACYYRRLGKPHAAMTSLKRALELEKRLENLRNAADTHLNMCAVLSQLGKHQEALEHAQEALITLQEGFFQGKPASGATAATDGDTSSSRLDRLSVLCIAYHNIGVEQEFLKDYAESVASYKKGVGVAEQYLGMDHSITTTIRNSYLAAKRTMATKATAKRTANSAGRDSRSPGKNGVRRLQSPRSGSLRLPSPLTQEKDRHNLSQIPTPRSIIADALARAPISTLPPLEVQSSVGAKNKTKVAKEVSKGGTLLSPTDPFFSPRFRFEDEAKTKKPQRRTSTGDHTPGSSKARTEARKSEQDTAARLESVTTGSNRVDEKLAPPSPVNSGEEGESACSIEPPVNAGASLDSASARSGSVDAAPQSLAIEEPRTAVELGEPVVTAALSPIVAQPEVAGQEAQPALDSQPSVAVDTAQVSSPARLTEDEEQAEQEAETVDDHIRGTEREQSREQAQPPEQKGQEDDQEQAQAHEEGESAHNAGEQQEQGSGKDAATSFAAPAFEPIEEAQATEEATAEVPADEPPSLPPLLTEELSQEVSIQHEKAEADADGSIVAAVISSEQELLVARLGAEDDAERERAIAVRDSVEEESMERPSSRESNMVAQPDVASEDPDEAASALPSAEDFTALIDPASESLEAVHKEEEHADPREPGHESSDHTDEVAANSERSTTDSQDLKESEHPPFVDAEGSSDVPTEGVDADPPDADTVAHSEEVQHGGEAAHLEHAASWMEAPVEQAPEPHEGEGDQTWHPTEEGGHFAAYETEEHAHYYSVELETTEHPHLSAEQEPGIDHEDGSAATGPEIGMEGGLHEEEEGATVQPAADTVFYDPAGQVAYDDYASVVHEGEANAPSFADDWSHAEPTTHDQDATACASSLSEEAPASSYEVEQAAEPSVEGIYAQETSRYSEEQPQQGEGADVAIQDEVAEVVN